MPAVMAPGPAFEERAAELAARLGSVILKTEDERKNAAYVFLVDENGLTLENGETVYRADFMRMLPRLKYNNLTHEMIVKAAKIKNFGENPTAVDATAGMGEDSLLLAAAGFTVQMFERDPIIAELLGDALRRAKETPELREIAARMTLTHADSIEALRAMEKAPDLILLDPMFPKRQKNSLVKKKLQMIQGFEKPCPDEEELLAAAIAAGPKKIIIKRPAKGPFLAGRKPSYSLQGKVIRYDCLV